jgi:hypothetical protein
MRALPVTCMRPRHALYSLPQIHVRPPALDRLSPPGGFDSISERCLHEVLQAPSEMRGALSQILQFLLHDRIFIETHVRQHLDLASFTSEIFLDSLALAASFLFLLGIVASQHGSRRILGREEDSEESGAHLESEPKVAKGAQSISIPGPIPIPGLAARYGQPM